LLTTRWSQRAPSSCDLLREGRPRHRESILRGIITLSPNRYSTSSVTNETGAAVECESPLAIQTKSPELIEKKRMSRTFAPPFASWRPINGEIYHVFDLADKITATDYFFKKSAIFVLPREKMHHSFRAPTVQSRLKMSKHNSLKSNATVGGKRSVLKRFERVKLLKERGEWKQGKSPIGLPKTKHEG